MSNMGYCRFENTLPDLRDCYEHINDDDLNEIEDEYRLMLVDLCLKITRDFKGDSHEKEMAIQTDGNSSFGKA